MKLLLKIVAGLVAVLVLATVALNFLLSADAVRDRIATRVKEQTGRDLRVHGASSLLFLPNPRIVLTKVEITDPQARAGADLEIARLALDLSFMQLLGRRIDARQVVMERPVLTVRLKPQLGDGEQQGGLRTPSRDWAASTPRFIAAQAVGTVARRDIMLGDVRVVDGTVRILYDDSGSERRVEAINANLSLPHLVDPLTAKGTFAWKSMQVGFDLKLATPADLGTQRSARVDLDLNTDAIAGNFGGYVATRPEFSLQGDVAAKAQSVPSILAWLRREPAASAAIGSGEVSSHVTWEAGELSFTQTRFNLSHAVGQGQAILTLRSPKPYLRAALAVETLTLDPFFAGGGRLGSAAQALGQDAAATPSPAEEVTQDAAAAAAQPVLETAAEPVQAMHEEARLSPAARERAGDTANVLPSALDADININIGETKLSRLSIGQSALGLTLRDGTLDATLSSMRLYDGEGSGKFTLDAAKPVPSFSGNLVLEGVEAEKLLAAASGFSLLSGNADLELEISGEGTTAEEIRHSLTGKGDIDIDNGALVGLNLTEMIASLGAGRVPDLEQGPGAKTAFSTFGGTFTMASGVAESHDLEIKSPLLEVKARGTVDLVTGTLDFLAQPKIVAGAEGKGGANKLAGLSIPVRIEGPFAKPSFRPEVKGLFASPGEASKTVNQIGDILQKQLKGKPVGEALGRILGSVKIGTDAGDAESGGRRAPKAKPEEEQSAPAENDEARDPEMQDILR